MISSAVALRGLNALTVAWLFGAEVATCAGNVVMCVRAQAEAMKTAVQRIMERLNSTVLGWANYHCVGRSDPAHAAVEAHTTQRLC